VVLALPRGGVPVASEIARALGAPLDIVLVRKIGVPFQRELAVAAVVDGSAPQIVVNQDVAESAGIERDYIDAQAKQELVEIERRRKAYLQGRASVPVEGRTVILVDDGIATGASVRAALKALRRRNPRALVLAVPVAPFEAIDELRKMVDEVVCLRMPEPFVAIGLHYVDFHQVSDPEVIELLAGSRAEVAPIAGPAPSEAESRRPQSE
jgi:putative phosphoribosyl transferase